MAMFSQTDPINLLWIKCPSSADYLTAVLFQLSLSLLPTSLGFSPFALISCQDAQQLHFQGCQGARIRLRCWSKVWLSQCVATWTKKEAICILLDVYFVHHWWLVFSAAQDPLIHHGCHFGRAVHAFCNVQTLLTNGLMYMVDGDDTATAAWVSTSLECETTHTKFFQGKEWVFGVLQPFTTYSWTWGSAHGSIRERGCQHHWLGKTNHYHLSVLPYTLYRFRKVQMVLGQMTPKAWRVQSSTGSPQRDNPWSPTFCIMWSLDVASTTSILVCYFVQQVLIGRIQSTSLLTFPVDAHLILAQHKVETHEWPNPSSQRPVATIPVCKLCIWCGRSMERTPAQWFANIGESFNSYLIDVLFTTAIGLQTCFHFTKFSWPGTQSHAVRECTHSWYACHYQGIPCLHGNPGMFNCWHLLCLYSSLFLCRPALLWLLPKSFLAQIM